MDIEDIEREIRYLIQMLNEEKELLAHRLSNLDSDEGNLQAKIEKKRIDLERNMNRLKSMQNVRPAFMDEYEKLQLELQKGYMVYVEKLRNMDYLEAEVEALTDPGKKEGDEYSVIKIFFLTNRRMVMTMEVWHLMKARKHLLTPNPNLKWTLLAMKTTPFQKIVKALIIRWAKVTSIFNTSFCDILVL
jgi:hypothetical protein